MVGGRRRSALSRIVWAGVLAALAMSPRLAAQSPAVAPLRAAIDLGTLAGCCSEANAINASGQIVGSSVTYRSDFSTQHAFLWTPQAGMIDLGVCPGSLSSVATAVNASGQVVGTCSGGGLPQAFSWTAAGGMVVYVARYGSSASAVNDNGDVLVTRGSDVCVGQPSICAFDAVVWRPDLVGAGAVVEINFGGPFFCPSDTEAVAMNASTQVVGTCSFVPSGFPPNRAFSWTDAGYMIDLGTLPGMANSAAVAVNDSGEVVGTSSGDAVSHAFSWTAAGGMIDLGTLGGNASGASALNGVGQVAGWSTTGTDAFSHAFLWTPSSGFADLGTLGGDGSAATAVNDSGQVVGNSGILRGSPEYHGFAWTLAGGMQDLGTLGGSASSAVAVNAVGQVIGTASAPDGNTHAVLWQSTPLCQDTLTLGYSQSTLDVGFTLMTGNPATWSTALFYSGGLIGKFSVPLPEIVPAVSFTLPIAGFPQIGTVGVLSVLSDAGGFTCADWKTIDTGGLAATVQRPK